MITKEIKQLVRAAQLVLDWYNEVQTYNESIELYYKIVEHVESECPANELQKSLNNFPNEWKGENWDQEYLEQFNIYDMIGDCLTDEPIEAETDKDALYNFFIADNGDAHVTKVETDDDELWEDNQENEEKSPE